MQTQLPTPILSPKLMVPPSRLQLVPRERLLGGIDAGLHRKLTLISAPAGYGKSTLLSQWAAGGSRSLGWITLAAEDNDLERFFAYLIAALQIADVSLSNLDALLGINFSIQPLPLDTRMAILLNQLTSTKNQVVIILDDYHWIENSEIHDFLNAFLTNLPSNLHLILSTRADPPLRLARLRAKDQLNEFGEEDLRFTFPEARAFFNLVMRLELTDDQVEALETRTEGWVTGLQLAGLSLKDRKHPGELIESLTGTHRFILDYLVDEVFSDLPDSLQSFMMRVSILDRLSPDLCDAVIGELAGESGTQLQSNAVLEFLDASNLFVIPLDNQRQWYRFHHLFADFLQDRLANLRKNELPSLHARAAAWYADHDLLAESVHHSLAAGDIELAADLVQRQAKQLLGRGEIATLMHWIDELPEEVLRTRPQLAMAKAWAMLMHNPLKFIDIQEQLVERIATGFGITPQDLLRNLPESETGSPRRSGLAEFAMLQAYAQRDIKAYQETVDLFNAALQYLPESEMLLRGFALAGLASTYARVGAAKSAEEAFAQAARVSQAANSIYGYVACAGWEATMQAEQGQLRRASETYRRAVATLSEYGQRPLPLSGNVYTGLASVLMEWNELEEALKMVDVGLQIGTQVRDLDALLAGYALQARLYQALNQTEKAQLAIQKAEQQAQETKSIYCVYDTLAQKARLALVAGDVEEAQRWSAGRGLHQLEPARLEVPLAEIESIVYARLLLLVGRPKDALPVLDSLLHAQEQSGRIRAVIETLAHQALCYRAMNRMEEAIKILARTLLLAEPEGYRRVFIELGAPMAALLRAAGAQGHSPVYVQELLSLFAETATNPDGLMDTLSERELAVLQLVAEGMTNSEIATELVIAQSTVKTHINRIYSKLAVSTRTQAVARARQLQLLT